MSRRPAPLFHEEQAFRQHKVLFLLAILPAGFLIVSIWQVALGHPLGTHPLSNGNVIGWTGFLWLLYLRLITLKLVTNVEAARLTVSIGGLWSVRKISLAQIRNVEVVTYDPAIDYGGYGIRLARKGRAYIAAGNQGVRLTPAKGMKVLVGSQRPQELFKAIAASGTRVT